MEEDEEKSYDSANNYGSGVMVQRMTVYPEFICSLYFERNSLERTEENE